MLGQFIAGRYAGTWQTPGNSALSLGIMEEGYRIRWRKSTDVINRTDSFADCEVEGFFQGLTMGVSCVAKEWLPAVITSMQPYSGWAGTGASTFNLGTVGKADTDVAGILVLSATAGTPAATSPATMTFTYAIQSDDDVDMLFGPRHRVMPLSFRIYPYSSTGIKFFSST